VRRLIPRHPAQLVVWGFALAILLGTAALLLPFARAGAGGAPFLVALFTSTSAVCVTGLVTVDTATYWSPFGQATIMALCQIGGFGIMTLTSVLALLVARRLGLRTRVIAQLETGSLALGDVRQVVKGVAILSFLFEAVTAAILTVRFLVTYDYGLGQALWHATFHSVTAFNNAGFALYSDNLVGFVTDPWVSLTIAFAIIAGGLGFPVWIELWRVRLSPRRWSLHTKLTLSMTGLLVAGGTAAILGFEWSHDETLGSFGLGDKLVAGFFQGVTPRTAGFNTLDYAQMEPESLLVTDMLMFVGTGSAATGGGIKVTTFALLALMVLAEARGDPNVNAFGRRVPAVAQRQALTVAFLGINAVVIGALGLMAFSQFPLGQALFEAISAFGTVGLSTGITGDLTAAGEGILIALMFLGRTGPHVLAAALVLRERERLYKLPEERPIIG
jgi:potassium uptake TrkH family protein